MAVSTHPKGMDDVTIVLKDGTGTPVTLTAYGVMNNFQLSGLKAGGVLNEVTRHSSRGKKTGLTYGDRAYPSGSFSFQCTQISHASGGTIPDFLLRRNFYSANISKEGTGTRKPYTIDIQITIAGATAYGDDADHTFTLVGVLVTSLDYADGDPNSFAVSFDCNSVTGDLASAELT